MIIKPRFESDELKILGFLNVRVGLPLEIKQNYANLKKGFEGEVMFDCLTAELQCDCLILNDLLLKNNNSIFQIDSLVIADKLYLFEVKNFEGDYYYELDNFYSMSKKDLKNPLHQVNRSEMLLRQLLQKHGFKIPIEAWVIFINPEFTLYQSPKNKPILYPTQINRFMKNLDTVSVKLNGMHKRLAEQLVLLNQKDDPYPRLPSYDYDALKKGMTCAICDSFSIFIEGRKCSCTECGHVENVEAAVLRSVREFKLLFPDKKITTNEIFEWCRVVESKKTIRTILSKNFKIVGSGQWAYYE